MIRWRAVAQNLLMVVVALGGSLLLAEGAVRVFRLVPVNDYRSIVDADAPWRLRPGSSMLEDQPEFRVRIAINAAGYRDREFSRERAPGAARLALIGDSFTFGTGVEPQERASEVLEQELRDAGHPCEVYNFGKPGLDTYMARDVLARGVAPWRPDLAVLLIYLGNDITDNVRSRAQQDSVAGPAAVPPLRTRVLRGIRDRSRLFQFVVMRVAGIPALRALYNRMKAANLVGEIADQLEILDAQKHDAARLWSPTEEAIHAFAAEARTLGMPWAAVLIPGRLQYDDAVWSPLAASRGLDSLRYRRTLPNERLGGVLAAAGAVQVVDPLAAFRATGERARDTYYPVNGHFTADGQRVLGHAMSVALAPLVATLAAGASSEVADAAAAREPPVEAPPR